MAIILAKKERWGRVFMAKAGSPDNPLSPYAQTDQMTTYAARGELFFKIPYVASEARFN